MFLMFHICKARNAISSLYHHTFFSVCKQFHRLRTLLGGHNTLPTLPKSKVIQGTRKNRHFKESLEYARMLGKSLVIRGLTPTLHHAEKITGENRELLDSVNGIYIFDDLVVLKNSEAPAVLLEAAVIVNPLDEKRASSAQYQKMIADAVLEMMTRK